MLFADSNLCRMYTPNEKILKKYADVLVNFALGGGKGIKKGEVVRVSASESAKPLFLAVSNAIIDAGGHVMSNYAPDDEKGDKRRNESFTRYFYEHAQQHQIDFFPEKYLRGIAEQMDHSVFLLAEKDPHALKGVDPKKIMRRGLALKPFKDWQHKKEWSGKFTWTIALYGTPAMAKEAGLSEKEYWSQIIKACFLDAKNPVHEWKNLYEKIEFYRHGLNKLKIEKLHVKGKDVDLWIKLGKDRQWVGGGGANIPSFELF